MTRSDANGGRQVHANDLPGAEAAGYSLTEFRVPANVTVSAKISMLEKEALSILSRDLGMSLSTLIRLAVRMLIVEYYRGCGRDRDKHLAAIAEFIERTLTEAERLCRRCDQSS